MSVDTLPMSGGQGVASSNLASPTKKVALTRGVTNHPLPRVTLESPIRHKPVTIGGKPPPWEPRFPWQARQTPKAGAIAPASKMCRRSLPSVACPPITTFDEVIDAVVEQESLGVALVVKLDHPKL